MFSFARLVLANLFEQLSRARFLEEIEKFPEGLDEVLAASSAIWAPFNIFLKLQTHTEQNLGTRYNHNTKTRCKATSRMDCMR